MDQRDKLRPGSQRGQHHSRDEVGRQSLPSRVHSRFVAMIRDFFA